MDKVTRQCPQTTTFLKRKESRSGIEPRSTETIRLIRDGRERNGIAQAFYSPPQTPGIFAVKNAHHAKLSLLTAATIGDDIMVH